MISGQVLPSDTSETKATIGLTVQLSSTFVTNVISAAGTSSIHSTAISPGASAVGAMSSFTVMVCVMSVSFPQSSVME